MKLILHSGRRYGPQDGSIDGSDAWGGGDRRAFRRHTLLLRDDGLYPLQATLPNLTRSSLHRCLKRHGISRLP